MQNSEPQIGIYSSNRAMEMEISLQTISVECGCTVSFLGEKLIETYRTSEPKIAMTRIHINLIVTI